MKETSQFRVSEYIFPSNARNPYPFSTTPFSLSHTLSLSILPPHHLLSLRFSDHFLHPLIRKTNILLQIRRIPHSPPHQRRRHHQTPRQQPPTPRQICHIRHFPIINRGRNRRPRALHPLVKAGEVGEFARVVREGADEPVRRGLEDGVVEAVGHVQDHGAGVAAGGEVHGFEGRGGGVGDGGAGVAQLEGVAAAPDGEGEDEEHGPGVAGAQVARVVRVEGVPRGRGAEDLREPVEGVVEGAGADGEVGGVDVLELVGVEPVAGQEHGEEQQDVRVAAQEGEQAQQLGAPGWVFHQDDAAAVGANHVFGVDEGEGEEEAEGHENHEGDVGAVGDGAGGGVHVEPEGDLGWVNMVGSVRGVILLGRCR